MSTMTETQVTITDNITGEEVTCNKYDVSEAVGSWFAEAPEDVEAAVAELAEAVADGRPTGSYEEFLAVRVELAN